MEIAAEQLSSERMHFSAVVNCQLLFCNRMTLATGVVGRCRNIGNWQLTMDMWTGD